MTCALAPSTDLTWRTSVVMSAAGAFTSTATFLTRPSFLPSAWLTTPSTPATPSNAAPPSVIRALTAAATGYLPPLTRWAAVAACALVIRSPAWKADHARWLDAVVGGVHGRSAAAGAASTVSRTPLTVIRAPSMASTARTPPSFLSLPRSAWVSPPGTEAITSGTSRCVALAPASPGSVGAVPAGSPPADSPPAGTIRPFNASAAVPSAVPPAAAAPPEAPVPADAVLTDAVLTDAVLTDTVPADAGPAAFVPDRAVSAPSAAVWPPLSTATVAATAAPAAASPPAAVGSDWRRINGSLTVTQLYRSGRPR